jgi:hypothetical protein
VVLLAAIEAECEVAEYKVVVSQVAAVRGAAEPSEAARGAAEPSAVAPLEAAMPERATWVVGATAERAQMAEFEAAVAMAAGLSAAAAKAAEEKVAVG